MSGSPSGTDNDGGNGAPEPDAGSSGASMGTAGAPYGDAKLVSIFDGMSLKGWIDTQMNGWTAMNGVIHGNGPGRGVLYTQNDYYSFRFIFTLRHLPSTGGNGHTPCILFWGTRMMPLPDAIAGIQFDPPTSNSWDYRAGANKGNPPNAMGMPEFTKVAAAPTFDSSMWTQCEVLAMTGGIAKMACCQPAGGPSMPCKAKEVIDFNNPAAFRKGPIGLQVHNMGLHDEYKDLYIEENPTGTTLITM
jgi:hypothetical protein